MIADLARETRFRYFDEPLILAARDEAYAAMEEHVAALAEDPQRADRDERIATLVACPRPLAPLLSGRMREASPALQRALLETMTRRYYRMRALGEFAEAIVDGHALLTADYEHEGRRRHVVAAFAEHDVLAGELRACAEHARGLPDGEPVTVDLYAQDGGGAHEALAAELRAAIAAVAWPAEVERVVVGIAVPRRGRGMSAVDLLTFRLGSDGPVEDELLRGLHPMMGERIWLWRFSNFALERLPAAEDVYLFHGVARDEPPRRAPVRGRRGARPDAVARRERARGRAPGARAHGRGGLRGHPQLPGPPQAEQAPALEPPPAVRVAGDDRPHDRRRSRP